MYRINRKKPWSALKFIAAFLALAIIGLSTGYIIAKISVRSQKNEYLYTLPTSAPQPTPAPKNKAVLKPIEDIPKETSEPEVEEEYMYLVILEDKKTNVYSLSGNVKKFSHSLPIEPNALRFDDITALKEGIYLKSKDDLLSFIEDFSS